MSYLAFSAIFKAPVSISIEIRSDRSHIDQKHYLHQKTFSITIESIELYQQYESHQH
jgi:hypothetical protein